MRFITIIASSCVLQLILLIVVSAAPKSGGRISYQVWQRDELLRLLEQQPKKKKSFSSIRFENCSTTVTSKAEKDPVISSKSTAANTDVTMDIEREKSFVTFRVCSNDCNENITRSSGEFPTSCSDEEYHTMDLMEYFHAVIPYIQEREKKICYKCNQLCHTSTELPDLDDERTLPEPIPQGQSLVFVNQTTQMERRKYDNNGNRQLVVDQNVEDRGSKEKMTNVNDDTKSQNVGTIDCSTCQRRCDLIANIAIDGYVDATIFARSCQMIYDDGADSVLYAAPFCESNDNKITIGVYRDEGCTQREPQLRVDDYIMDDKGNSMLLSHALLKQVYWSSGNFLNRYYGVSIAGDVQCSSCGHTQLFAALPPTQHNKDYKTDNIAYSGQPMCQFIKDSLWQQSSSTNSTTNTNTKIAVNDSIDSIPTINLTSMPEDNFSACCGSLLLPWIVLYIASVFAVMF